MGIKERKEELKKQLAELENFEKELYKSNVFKLRTNTAFLQNAKITEAFDMWKGFKEFIEQKHEGSWRRENSSTVEITFKVLTLREDGYVGVEDTSCEHKRRTIRSTHNREFNYCLDCNNVINIESVKDNSPKGLDKEVGSKETLSSNKSSAYADNPTDTLNHDSISNSISKDITKRTGKGVETTNKGEEHGKS